MDEVIDRYELSPMQQGMLFHAVSGSADGVDIEQIAMTLREALDLDAFAEAWRRIVARHAILRTRFRWTDVAEPVQEVLAAVELPTTVVDWRDAAPTEAAQRFDTHRADDRRRGLDLSVAPAMRLFVARIAEEEWRVLWTFHHALLDGRSFAIVLRELFAEYAAAREGTRAALSPARPFRDYIEWRRSLDFSSARTFWQDALRGFHAPTPFPIDGSGTGEDSREAPFDAHQRVLPAALGARVREAARRLDVTPNTLLQAAWAILLHRYSGESDIVFGATRAGREGFAGADAMVGLFINTLPMRVGVEGDAALEPWLRALRAQQIALRPYDQVPLASVQGWSAVARGKPLFESVVVYDHQSLDRRLAEEGWHGRRFEYTGQTNFPLALIAYGDEDMLVRLEYSRRRFSDAATARMLGHFVALLESLADAGAGARIRDLEMLSPAEIALARGGEPTVVRSAHATLHEAFEARAAQTPDAIALTFADDEARIELTYAELDSRAEALARHLCMLGVRPNELVGLRTERNADLVIALLAILKAGGAYLPLDPVYPTERIAFMLEDAGVRVVLTQHSLAAELAALPVTCVAVDAPLPAVESVPDAPCAAADDLAYVIYTSGSTGRPKGVRISHRNVLRLFAATDAWFGFGPTDVWTLFHSYAFDFSVWELWGALLYGGRVVIVPQETSRDPFAFRELLLRECVTVLNQTPTAFRQLIDADRASPRGEFALRYVVFGGEALELQSLRPWMDRYGEERPRLINMYGITETTVHVTYRPLARADLDAGAGSVIGVPIPDLRVHVLDVDGRPAPVGVPGEMYVAGAGVASGYLNRPELTAQRFLPDPFARQGDTAARMYRSGDLARRLDSGELEYLGRIDQQVKIRGFRIELGEIEAVIAQHPRVRQVAVIDREDVPGDKRLAAYLVAEPPREPLLAELRETLRQRLPDYMTPAHFVFVDALPLTPNGKLDRKALPAPDAARVAAGKPYVAPRNATEAALAEAWKDVLRVERVGIDDHFFELGGDSILSIQVIARCHQRGLRVTPRDLFKHPTIAELAKVVTTTTAPRLEAEDTPSGTVALTPIQKWFFEQRFEDAHHWNQAFLFTVAPDFDADAFDVALAATVAHHDALRLRFREEGGARTQYYGEMPDVRAERVDLSEISEDARSETITRHAVRVQASLDLANGPLIRAAWFMLGSGIPGRLLLVVHHLVVDGVSWRLLREDLEASYLAAKSKQAPALPPKTTSMRRWAERSDAFASTAEVGNALPHWLAVANTPPTVLPADADAGVTSELRRFVIALDADETRGVLQALPRAFRTRINDVLLGSLTRALQQVAGGSTFRIDLEGHGREHIADDVNVSRTVGWFTTLFPVALDVPSGGDAAEAALAVRDRLREVPHHGMSYGLLRYASPDRAVREALAACAPSTVLFNYLGQFDAVVADSKLFSFAAESTGPWRSPRAHRTHALEIVALVRDGRLEIEWNYDAALHRDATISRAAEAMRAALREMLAAAASGAVRFTPADFPLVRLGTDALQRIAASHPGAEDVLPLTPMQRLFFAMEASAAGLGLEQWQFRIEGAIDASALRRAFEWTIARHAILRTAFIDDGAGEPLQVVVRDATLPWHHEDWRDRDDAVRSKRLATLLREDGTTAFDLARPPAMRVTLIRTADDAWHLVWTTHHLCIDGWSWPVVFRDVARAYAAYASGSEPAFEAAIPFRDYVEWLAASAPAADDFWRAHLRGVDAPTPLRAHAPAASDGTLVSETTLTLDENIATALRQLARRHQITPAVALNAAWALVLAHRADAGDVVFGASFSGRPPEIRGIESMAGPCVNTLPVRVAVTPDLPISDWLTRLQHAQVDLAQHQYTALGDIQRCSAVPPRYRLFDSLVVFQNYQIDADALRLGDAALMPVAAPEATNYPLTITVTLGEELRIRLLNRPSMLADEDARELAAELRLVLEGMARAADTNVAALAALLPAESRGVAKAASAAVPARREDYAAPTNEIERVIAEVWQSLFDVERISLDDNFFELGGHSLLLVRAHAALRDRLRIDLPIVALLQYPTARALARHLAGGHAAAAAATDAAIDRARKQREALARQRRLSGRR